MTRADRGEPGGPRLKVGRLQAWRLRRRAGLMKQAVEEGTAGIHKDPPGRSGHPVGPYGMPTR